jgi:hypothetical protein
MSKIKEPDMASVQGQSGKKKRIDGIKTKFASWAGCWKLMAYNPSSAGGRKLKQLRLNATLGK